MSSAQDTSSPAGLLARPEARSFRVDELVRGLLSGQICVPELPLRWDPSDALALIDSIDRGYPVGILLLWQRPAPALQMVHGSVSLDTPARGDALWVVDGQQRLLSLLRVFAGGGHPAEPYAGFYDLREVRLERLAPAASPGPYHLPLTELLDPPRLLGWLSARPELGIRRQAALHLGERLREYKVPAYVIATADEAIVRDICRRADDNGKRLDRSAVFGAIHRAVSPALHTLSDVATSLADFGPIEEHVLSAMLIGGSGSLAARARGARPTLQFLREDAGIPHVSLVPVSSALSVLSHFFARFPAPHPRSRELLARWLWRDALAGVRSGAPSRNPELKALQGDDEHKVLQDLLRCPGPRAHADMLQFGPLKLETTASRIHLLALLDLAPRDLVSGELVSPPLNASADDYRSKVRPIDPALPTELANCMFHGPTQAELLTLVTGSATQDSLATHAISIPARDALRAGDSEQFLQFRRADLRRLIHRFADRRAQWHEPDTPPVEALHIGGD